MPSLMKKSISYYEFMDKFGILSPRIVTSRTIPRIALENKKELHIVAIKDWYFMKEMIIILRYGFYEVPFLLPKFVTPLMYSLEMVK